MGLNSNVAQRYSSGAILLHWLIAFALAAEMAIGFTMPKDASGFALFQLHKSIGITILLLSVLRLLWRLMFKAPPKVEQGFAGFLASTVHVLLYAFMVLAPLTGWLIVSSAEIDVPTLLFGVVHWPHLPVPQSLNHTYEEAHELIAFIGIALFLLHVAGALRHQFMKGGNYLARMAPWSGVGPALLLTAGVFLLGGAIFFGIGPREEEHDHATDHGPEAEAHEHDEAVEGEADSTEEAAPDEALEEHDHSTHEPDDEAADATPAAEEEVAAAAETVASQPVAGPPPSWTIQPGGSLRFSVASGDMQMNGSFGSWGGSIAMDPDNPSTAQISIDIQLGSATMNDATQDQMLRGADFLAASANPTATWRSTSVTAQGGGRYRAEGTLSLKGVSRAQAITFTLSGSGNRRSVTGQAEIDRNAFSVGTGSNAAGLGGSVTVNFAFDATS
jgi:cytochrome b561/polyisoprenoid-binding protein YceI